MRIYENTNLRELIRIDGRHAVSNNNKMTKDHFVSARDAARAIGVSTAAISKAIKVGRLPYVEKTGRGYRIDRATLFRVFGRRPVAREEIVREVMALRVVNARLEGEITTARALLDAERRRAERAEGVQDAWRTLCKWLLKKRPAAACLSGSRLARTSAAQTRANSRRASSARRGKSRSARA